MSATAALWMTRIGWPCLALLVVASSPPRSPVRRTVGTMPSGGRGEAVSPAGRRQLLAVGRILQAVGSRLLPAPTAGRLARIDPVAVGRVVVVCAVGLVVVPSATPALLVMWWLLARRRVRLARRRQLDATTRAIPDLIDLVRLALDGGCTIPLGFMAIAGRYRGALDADVRLVARDLGEGRGTADALEGLLARVGEPIRPLCSALLAGERYGLPTSAMLDALAVEARATRRRHDEQRARRLPITMLFPLITCTLPAFALLTVVPLLASGLQAVRW